MWTLLWSQRCEWARGVSGAVQMRHMARHGFEMPPKDLGGPSFEGQRAMQVWDLIGAPSNKTIDLGLKREAWRWGAGEVAVDGRSKLAGGS